MTTGLLSSPLVMKMSVSAEGNVSHSLKLDPVKTTVQKHQTQPADMLKI